MNGQIKLDGASKVEVPDQKMQELRDKAMNYHTWRWSGVSLYQSVFVVFVTAAVILLVDMISGEDKILKGLLLVLLISLSLDFYKRMLRQTSKPIFVCENMVATVENGPYRVKEKDGMDYYVYSISNPVHQVENRMVKK